jgi:hypothetical protein
MKRPSRPLSSRNIQSGQDEAVALAISALTFIAQEPERLGRFLALTGIGPESLRSAAREPGFLLGVLDHVSGDETLVIAFAADRGVDPAAVSAARAALARDGREGTDTAC